MAREEEGEEEEVALLFTSQFSPPAEGNKKGKKGKRLLSSCAREKKWKEKRKGLASFIAHFLFVLSIFTTAERRCMASLSYSPLLKRGSEVIISLFPISYFRKCDTIAYTLPYLQK